MEGIFNIGLDTPSTEQLALRFCPGILATLRARVLHLADTSGMRAILTLENVVAIGHRLPVEAKARGQQAIGGHIKRSARHNLMGDRFSRHLA